MRAKKTPGPKPGFRAGRHKLAAASDARGKRVNNIWKIYSGRLQRDLVVKSDAECDHICLLEGDEEVDTYEPEPEPQLLTIGGQMSRTQFDALVHLRNHHKQLREVKDSDRELDLREQAQLETQRTAAGAAGFDYLRITRADMDVHRQLINNWRRALPFMSACRSLVLEPYSIKIVTGIKATGPVTLEQIVAGMDQIHQSILIAAVFQAIQRGRLRSDMDSKPLCALSVFRVREADR